jgi:ABC-type multidrug transport system ATPase subunit
MVLKLEEIGKRFKRDWIFKGITSELGIGVYAVLGGNGSGKSTLLKIISGASSPTQGKVWLQTTQGKKLEKFEMLNHIAFAAPYMELPEELTLREFFTFSHRIKPYQAQVDFAFFVKKLLFENQEDKPIKYFSSGMKQRLRLGHVFLSACDVLILDEPSSNLDAPTLLWYQRMLYDYGKNKIVLVGSNFINDEYPNAIKTILLQEYKVV